MLFRSLPSPDRLRFFEAESGSFLGVFVRQENRSEERRVEKTSSRIAEAIAARNAVDTARTARDNAQKEREKSENTRNQCDKNITEHKSKFDTVSVRITDTIAGIRKATAAFIASDGISDWKPESPFNARAFLQKFIAEHSKRQALDKRIQIGRAHV